jgi:hypothetical protein
MKSKLSLTLRGLRDILAEIFYSFIENLNRTKYLTQNKSVKSSYAVSRLDEFLFN